MKISRQEFSARIVKTLAVTLIAGGIIPPVPALARTSFDDLMEQNGGQVPYPFEQFTAPDREQFERDRKAGKLDPNATFQPDGVLIPDGRSLQKKKADFTDPRLLIEIPTLRINKDGMTGVPMQDRMFVGYAPRAKSLEVITWNRDLRKWDFIVIENYGPGLTPKVKPISPDTCTSCHQAGGPIFARNPWSESAGGQFSDRGSAEVRRRINELRKTDPNFNGFNITQSGDRPFQTSFFDDNVRSANTLLQLAGACSTACGEDRECRSFLLEKALTNDPFRDEPTKTVGLLPNGPKFAKFDAVIRKNWPANGFAYPSSVIPDRDPTKNSEKGGTTFVPNYGGPSGLSLPNGRAITPDPGVDVTKGGLVYDENQARESLPDGTESVNETTGTPLGSPANPRTKRPLVSAIPADVASETLLENAFPCLGFTSRDRKKLSRFSAAQIAAALRKLQADKKKFDALLDPWPPNVNKIMGALMRNLGDTKEAKCYDFAASRPEPIPPPTLEELKNLGVSLEVQVAREEAEGKPYEKFMKYCSECHYGESATAGVLPLTKLNELQAYNKSSGDTPQKRLLCNIMPPPDSKMVVGEDTPNPTERAAMIKLLGGAPPAKNGKDPCAE